MRKVRWLSDQWQTLFHLTWMGLVFLVLCRSFFTGGIHFGSDNLLTGFTVRTFAQNAWRELGHLPYWNPFISAGVPYLANFVSGGFYPLNWLMLPLPPHLAINLLLFLHLLLSTLFAYATLKRWFDNSTAACYGALCFNLSGVMVMRLFAGHYDAISVIAWGWALFYFWTGFWQTRKAYHVLFAGLALALAILAGYPQYVYLLHLVLMPFIIYVVFTSANRTLRWRAVVAAAGYFFIGLALSAVQWLPALSILRHSVRAGGLDWAYLTEYSYPFQQWISLIWPHYLGDGLSSHYRGVPYIWETTAYLGLSTIPWLFAVNWRDKLSRACLVGLILFMVLAMGAQVGWLYRGWTEIMPLQKIFRVPARFMTPLLWLYVFLITQGLANYLRSKRRFWPQQLFILILLFDLGGAHARYFGTTSLQRFAKLNFDFGDWRVYSSDSHYKLLSQAPMHEIYHMAGREAMLSPHYNDFLNAVARAPLSTNQDNFQLEHFDPSMSLASVRWYVTDKPTNSHPQLSAVGNIGKFHIFENMRALPRAFFIKYLIVETRRESMLGRMQKNPQQFHDLALVESSFPQMRFKVSPQLPKLVKRLPDEIVWDLPDNKTPQYMVITDNYDTGWKATLDQQIVPIYRTNGWMQGIYLPPHSRQLQLNFYPPDLALAKRVSLGALMLWLLILIIITRQYSWRKIIAKRLV